MVIARFDSTGYTVLHGIGKNEIDFTEDGHQRLMDYASQDIVGPSKLLESYVAKKMNLQTFELYADYDDTNDDKMEINNALATVHRYYLKRNEIIYDAIGIYFNALLLQDAFPKSGVSGQGESIGGGASNAMQNPKWYHDRFQTLTEPFLHFINKNRTSDEYYQDFKKQYISYHLTAEQSEPQEAPEAIGFHKEILIQQHIRRMLYCIFDLSTPILNHLELSRRAWLYDNAFVVYDEITYNWSASDASPKVKRVQKRLTLGASHRDKLLEQTEFPVYADQAAAPPPDQDDDGPMSMFSVNINDLEARSPELRQRNHKRNTVDFIHNATKAWVNEALDVSGKGYYSYRPSDDSVPPDTLDALNEAMDFARSLTDGHVSDEYEIEDLYTLLYLELAQLLKENLGVKRCKHCGMYFVVTDMKWEYCNRGNGKNNRPCYAEAKNGGYQQKTKDDPFHKVYNRAYKKYYARFKKTGDQAAYDAWYNPARELLTLYNHGELDMDIAEFESRIK